MRVWLAGVGMAALLAAGFAASAAAPSRDVQELSDGWRFTAGDPEQAETVGYDDKGWKPVTVPHDWQIAGPFDQKARAGGAGGFLPTGVAWYRRTLDVRLQPGRRWFVELDGVMERSGVWINGHNVGYRPNGYVGQRYDLTPFLKGDGRDVLAVRADTSHAPSSRWYAGGGVYRKARLIATGEAYVVQNSAFVTTPSITDGKTTVRVQADVANAGETPRQVGLDVVLLGPDGREVGRARAAAVTLAPGATERLSTELEVAAPQRWSLDDPKLYRAEVRVVDKAGEASDVETVRFGVRTAEFKADTGFWLNGRNLKLKGVALHEDGGAVGMAVPLSIWRQRLVKLKAMGVNAIRTAHNPAAPGLLDLADELGFVVMDELYDQWNVAKTPYDYHLFFGDWSRKDAFDIVARDRNHPSVAIWSIGNEIHDTAFPVQAKAALKSLSDVVHATDPTRPVTQALFRPNVTGDYENGLADMLDVVGQNYRENELLKAHADNPARKIIGTENSHNRTSWLPIRDSAAAAGMFLWTGVDYLGEADRRGWPNIDSPSGLLDRTGAPRLRGLERESWWSETPVVHIVRNAAPEAAAPSTGVGKDPPCRCRSPSRSPRRRSRRSCSPTGRRPTCRRIPRPSRSTATAPACGSA
jgi:beta-galactosidase